MLEANLFKVYITASLLLWAAFLSQASPPSSRIVNGVLVETGEFPYVVSLQLNDKHICAGLIYNDRFVLTAASCVQNIVDVTDLFVNVADLNFLDDEEVDQEAYSVIDIQLAPDDDGNPGPDDLAVVHLTRPLVFGPNVNCIKVGEVEPTGSSKGIIIGYGALESGGIPSNRCRKGEVTMAGRCTNSWPDYLEPYMICAGSADDVQKPCDFDYGSPLVQDGVAVGILSQQNNCQSSPYDSSIYTRLASYYYWIREEANTQPNNCFTTTTTPSTSTTQTTTTPITTTTTPTTTTTRTTTTTTSTTTRTTTPTTPRPTVPIGYVCPDDNGFFPIDPNQCLSNYYVCVNGAPSIGTCPAGGLFDPATLNCELEEQASCNYKCPASSGFFPVYGHETDQCFNGYVTCLGGIAYPTRCPPKSVFDPEDGFCVPASSNSCPDEITTTPGTPTTLTPVDPNSPCCPGVGEFPLQGSCTQYVVCASDYVPVIASCRVGQVFNPYLGICDDPANVPGCNFYSITDYIQGLKNVGIKSSRDKC